MIQVDRSPFSHFLVPWRLLFVRIEGSGRELLPSDWTLQQYLSTIYNDGQRIPHRITHPVA